MFDLNDKVFASEQFTEAINMLCPKNENTLITLCLLKLLQPEPLADTPLLPLLLFENGYLRTSHDTSESKGLAKFFVS